MEAALVIFLLALVFPFVLFALASGFLLCVKPDRLRPPWWDWGVDETGSPKVEKPVETSIVEVAKPIVVATKVEPKPAPKPRW